MEEAEVAYRRWVVLKEALNGGLLVLGGGEVVPGDIRSVKLACVIS